VRINGLVTYNSLIGRFGQVPEAEGIPSYQRGRWGQDNGYTFICLESGHLFVLKGSPNSKLQETINELCPNGDGLRVAYFNGESLWLDEVLERISDPYCRFPTARDKNAMTA